MNETDNMYGFLDYLLKNCLIAYDELCKTNKGLKEELGKLQRKDYSSDVNIQYLGDMNRIIQDCLIIRVRGLFDKDKNVVSFEKLFSNNQDFKKIKDHEIIKYIIEYRNNFVAHNNKDYIENENQFPTTTKICDSNLKELLGNLQSLLRI